MTVRGDPQGCAAATSSVVELVEGGHSRLLQAGEIVQVDREDRQESVEQVVDGRDERFGARRSWFAGYAQDGRPTGLTRLPGELGRDITKGGVAHRDSRRSNARWF